MTTLRNVQHVAHNVLQLLAGVPDGRALTSNADAYGLRLMPLPTVAWHEDVPVDITSLRWLQEQVDGIVCRLSQTSAHMIQKQFRLAITSCWNDEGATGRTDQEMIATAQIAFEQRYHRTLQQIHNVARDWVLQNVEGQLDDDDLEESSSEQADWLEILKEAYDRSPAGQLSVRDSAVLAQVTGQSEKKIRTWFSNRRARQKAKEKKEAQEKAGIRLRPVKGLPKSKSRAIKGLPVRATSPVPSLSRSVSSTSSTSTTSSSPESNNGSLDLSSIFTPSDVSMFDFQAPMLGSEPMPFDSGVVDKMAWEMPDMNEVMALLDQQMEQAGAQPGMLNFDISAVGAMDGSLQQGFSVPQFGAESFMTPQRPTVNTVSWSSPAVSQVSQELMATPNSLWSPSSALSFPSPASSTPAAREPSLEPSTVDWISNVLPFDFVDAPFPSTSTTANNAMPMPASASLPPQPFLFHNALPAPQPDFDLLALLNAPSSLAPAQPAGQVLNATQTTSTWSSDIFTPVLEVQQQSVAVPVTSMGMSMSLGTEDAMEGMEGFMDWQ